MAGRICVARGPPVWHPCSRAKVPLLSRYHASFFLAVDGLWSSGKVSLLTSPILVLSLQVATVRVSFFTCFQVPTLRLYGLFYISRTDDALNNAKRVSLSKPVIDFSVANFVTDNYEKLLRLQVFVIAEKWKKESSRFIKSLPTGQSFCCLLHKIAFLIRYHYPCFPTKWKCNCLFYTDSYVRYIRDFIGAGKCFGVGRIFVLNFPKNLRRKIQRKTSKNTFAAFVSYQSSSSAIFISIFRDIVKVSTLLAQIFLDVARILREFAQILTKSKYLGVSLHPFTPTPTPLLDLRDVFESLSQTVHA